MGLRINTNISSMIAQRHLAESTRLMGDSYRRLSSGLRIQQASDDAAGLAISERMRSQIRALEQARRNASDGISIAQTVEGSLDGVSSVLIRMKELALQAANDTIAEADKDVLDAEMQGLIQEIDRISRSSEYANLNLLDGSLTTISLQIGINNNAEDSVDLTLSSTLATALAISTLDIGSGGDTSFALTQIDAAIDTVTGLRGRIGAVANRLDFSIDNLGRVSESLSTAESRIRDVDVAAETARLTRAQIMQQAALSVLAQANLAPQAALSLLQ